MLLTTDRRRFRRDVLARFPLSEADVAQRWQAWLSGRVLATWEDEQVAIAGFVDDVADELQLRGEARTELLQLDYRSCIRGFPDAHAALGAVRRRGVAVGVLTNNSARASPWAWARLAYDEILTGQLALALVRNNMKKSAGLARQASG
ncbi:MAG: hypothetical protein AAF721_22735, partial [Myxococcota bacterium]